MREIVITKLLENAMNGEAEWCYVDLTHFPIDNNGYIDYSKVTREMLESLSNIQFLYCCSQIV
jgi:hypothetical protein